ncbi:hypothetical protein [Hymenobacter perfusus]|uniref:Uncharacterized protein n=1 Tax=Hymenobacter perfusus TaxID=1236770 RepID=A0A3R9MJX7_9BACT|nr:hypothetical protein [Hymenobacter perfusus]RSK42175.1 hypothetical protein EI293_14695 [Hymenobacter perfusus]
MPAALYLPRRHRRHLLFPPGLLALAGLLWLGCVTMVRIVPPKKTVLEFAAWPPKVCSVDSDVPAFVAEAWRGSPACLPLTALEKFRPWYTSWFTGSVFSDYFALQNTRFVARDLEQNPDLDQGFRVHFAPQATYNNLVQVLDLFNQENVRKSWVDFYHLPVTMYSYTEKPLLEEQSYSSGDFRCLLCGDVMPYIPTTSEVIKRWLAEYRAAILSPVWRNTWLLLLLLSALSIRQLTRLRAAYRY